MKYSRYVVTPHWLHAHLDDPGMVVVDASWYLPAHNRDPYAEYLDQHVPGAVFFDIDKLSDPASKLPHTLASPEHFAQEVGKLGISETDTIVVYDGMGLFSAARAWWNFRIMGADEVFILDGGFPLWLSERLPTGTGHRPPPVKTFKPEFRADRVVDFDAMNAAVKAADHAIADARPAGRFSGSDPEPRKGMRSGHMPGATNIPASSLIRDGKLLPLAELGSVLDEAGLNDGPTITTCGSGVTAAIISLALDSLGRTDHKLYDGSWSEWGGRDDTEIEVSE